MQSLKTATLLIQRYNRQQISFKPIPHCRAFSDEHLRDPGFRFSPALKLLRSQFFCLPHLCGVPVCSTRVALYPRVYSESCLVVVVAGSELFRLALLSNLVVDQRILADRGIIKGDDRRTRQSVRVRHYSIVATVLNRSCREDEIKVDLGSMAKTALRQVVPMAFVYARFKLGVDPGFVPDGRQAGQALFFRLCLI